MPKELFSSPVFVSALLMVGGLACAFFGYRMMRLWLSVAGFVLGAGVGLKLCEFAGLGTPLNFIIAVLLGVAIAWLCFRIIRVGAFVLAATLGYVVASVFAPSQVVLWVVTLICGILGTALLRGGIKALTAIGGSFVAVEAINDLVAYPVPDWGWLILWIVLAIGGLVYQFVHGPRR